MPEYKLRVLEEADGCREAGEIGALLRREGLYTSNLSAWREQRRVGALGALSQKRGRKPRRDPQAQRVAELERENSRLREELRKARVIIDVQKTVSDRGPSMTSKTLRQLLADLSITRSLSRPYTSNDNPFSEAQFSTLKYRPAFPDRFGSYQHGLSFLRPFFHWCNEEHHHGGIGFFTPGQVHRGEVAAVLAERQRALDAAFRAHPEHFKGRAPHAPAPPTAVWINPPALDRNGAPSTRSRQNLRIDGGQGKDEALRASQRDATDRGKAAGSQAGVGPASVVISGRVRGGSCATEHGRPLRPLVTSRSP
jgi:transposase-like protein